jgi:hypothetical protein
MRQLFDCFVFPNHRGTLERWGRFGKSFVAVPGVGGIEDQAHIVALPHGSDSEVHLMPACPTKLLFANRHKC